MYGCDSGYSYDYEKGVPCKLECRRRIKWATIRKQVNEKRLGMEKLRKKGEETRARSPSGVSFLLLQLRQ